MDEGRFEALFLSCHGDLDPRWGPILVFENAAGGEDWVGPARSSKRSAPIGPSDLPFGMADGGIRRGRAGEFRGRDAAHLRRSQVWRHSRRRFARRLMIANVIGWDGSVYDADASAASRRATSSEPVPALRRRPYAPR